MNEVFPIIPASGRIFWFLAPVASLLLGLLGLFGYITHASRNVQFQVSHEGLRIRGDIYGRMVPAVSLISAESKQVDLRRDTSYRPTLRTNGIGLPGYRSGWFRLRNGEKALLFLTDASRVVYIPTRNGYSLLLSVENPELFMQSIRRISN